MNISKNLLSLGLIAVISGISTAQTYTATAGTNGTTDIQSDYSMSTGDGASVSVDVPLEFELPKQVVLAIKSPDGSFTTNPIFQNWIPLDIWSKGNPQHFVKYDGQTYSFGLLGGENILGADAFSNVFRVNFGVYTNTDNINILIDSSDYILTHENGAEAGQLELSQKVCHSHLNDSTNTRIQSYLGCGTAYNVTNATTDNIINGGIWLPIIAESLDATDRAGKYFSNVTITVSTL